MKKWKVTAEINMDASRYDTVVVRANTERKAYIFAEKEFKKRGAFYVTNMKVVQEEEPV